MCSCDFDVIVLTETWLKEDVASSEYFNSNYQIYRVNSTGRGRGIIIAVKSEYQSRNMQLLSPVLNADLLGVKVMTASFTLYIIAVYITPAANVDIYHELFGYIESQCTLDKNVIIIGDFNIPQYVEHFIHNDNMSGSSLPLYDFISFNNLTQHNKILNRNNRLLDLVLSSSDISCQISSCDSPLVKEDNHHPSLIVNTEKTPDISVRKFSPKCASFKYNFRKANFVHLYDSLLCTDWTPVFVSGSVNQACQLFYNILYQIFDCCVPKTLIRGSRYPVWYTKELISMIKHKSALWRKYKRYKLDMYLDQIRQLRKQIKYEIRSEYKKFIKSAEDNLRADPSKLWSFIDMKKNSSRIPGNMKYKESELNTAQDIVEAFASYFSSVFENGHSNTTTICDSVGDKMEMKYRLGCKCCVAPSCDNVNILHKFHLTPEDIVKNVKKLKNKCTAGPDEVPSFLVKDCIQVLSHPLCYIFNLILSLVLQSFWMSGKLRKPIAILSNFGKIFESILAEHLYNHIEPSINENQHGFVRKKSTVTNLLEFTQYVLNEFDSFHQVDVVYTDLSKAFDIVDHKILLHRLSEFDLNMPVWYGHHFILSMYSLLSVSKLNTASTCRKWSLSSETF
ncbi:uncharacterized protein LOC135138647 [Zophobas morio]|uniref:uncharacterized protein LOC135138647 n=1 Tax=Zophobas morio TaxID=2755281 RepID=UPI0030833615